METLIFAWSDIQNYEAIKNLAKLSNNTRQIKNVVFDHENNRSIIDFEIIYSNNNTNYITNHVIVPDWLVLNSEDKIIQLSYLSDVLNINDYSDCIQFIFSKCPHIQAFLNDNPEKMNIQFSIKSDIKYNNELGEVVDRVDCFFKLVNLIKSQNSVDKDVVGFIIMNEISRAFYSNDLNNNHEIISLIPCNRTNVMMWIRNIVNYKEQISQIVKNHDIYLKKYEIEMTSTKNIQSIQKISPRLLSFRSMCGYQEVFSSSNIKMFSDKPELKIIDFVNNVKTRQLETWART